MSGKKSKKIKTIDKDKKVKNDATKTAKSQAEVLSRVKNRGQNIIRSRRDRRGTRKTREMDRRVVSLRRVAKVRKGARRLRFSACVVVGDKKGRVGVGFGRALDTKSAIDKATKKAEKTLIKVPLRKGTIPHEVENSRKATKVLIKPAGPGTGIIAGSSVRAVMELCGVHNVLTKIIGRSNNPIENARCAFDALAMLKTKPLVRRGFQKIENKYIQWKGD